MARSRNIKPGFFTNDVLGELDPCARLLFVGLWVLADREGRVEDRPRKIRAEVLPYDAVDVNALLDELKSAGFIERYEADGKKCLRVVNWHKHQTPHHMEVPSDLPAPNGAANRYNHEPLTKQQRERVMRRDRGRCVICQATESLHVDHIDPVSNGGSSDDANLRILCSTCNLSKGKRETISAGRQAVIDSTSTQHQHDVAPLIPSSLIPDSLFLDSSPLIPDSSVAPSALPGRPQRKRSDQPAPSSEAFDSYASAYAGRYGVQPVRNASVNAQLAQLVGRLGADDAPKVAAWFVGHQNGLYVSAMHPTNLLLRDCEKLRTEWATGRQVTRHQAAQADKTQTNANAFAGLIARAEQEAKDAQH